jgi:hypothetical protein
MSSPGVMHARQFEPIEWMSLDPLDAQEAHGYPASYEDARRRILSELLSIPAAPLEEMPAAVPRDPIADNLDFEESGIPLRECPNKPAPIKHDPSGGKQREPRGLYYVSSFDRLTSRKRKAKQPALVSIGVHLRDVLTVTAALSLSSLVYASVGGAFPGLSVGVRSFLGDQAAKVRLILPRHDVGTQPAAPAPMSGPSVNYASADPTLATGAQSPDRLLYSTASIAFTPLK